MKILAINSGSSSLKFCLYEMPEEKIIISGNFERIADSGSFYSISFNNEKKKNEIELNNHQDAINILIEELMNYGVISKLEDIDGIGHRLLHGKDKYKESQIVNNEMLENIRTYRDFGPLHMYANVEGIQTFMVKYPNIPNVAVIDTTFHFTMDPVQYLYSCPYEWYEKYGIRRYGFHGTSYRFVYETICNHLKKDKINAILCHIGSGASVCAVKEGKCIATSMGFTPLAGVTMGTRTGDIDPSILPYIMREEKLTIEEAIHKMNYESGLLGLSSVGGDSRDIEDGIKEGNERCQLAQDKLTTSIANYIAMYHNLLDGNVDVMCLTAGICENSASVRKGIIDKVKSLGIKIDDSQNDFRKEFRLISTNDSKFPVYVIPTNEELIIARDTYNLVK